ncbi:hypothetical protein MACK_000286 [Theileria orientalis]|uniref:Rieske domain-containing protein n=1 Tax=Theileria orientalis TaxID=68886 RepID=A0A976QWG3_THEOR|nr:hypothetical protein MACK_000286 [Theileria orientalis]
MVEEFHSVGSASFVDRPKRVVVSGRKVVVWHYKGCFYATDANCYHSAGALERHEEDIEEICNQPCIRCPQHKYIISITTGESFYEAVEIVVDKETKRRKIQSLGWKSKGIMQRTHNVKLENGNVYVQLSDLSETLPSDQYAYL